MSVATSARDVEVADDVVTEEVGGKDVELAVFVGIVNSDGVYRVVPDEKGSPFSSFRMFSVVTRAISLSASHVRNA